MTPGPVVPSARISEKRHPALHAFLAHQVDMQIADLRLLLRLPAPELERDVGCNLTTCAALLNMISGFSVWFYETERAREITAQEARKRGRRSRQRFVGFIEEYWPQIAPEPSGTLVAPVLYTIRNSLVHDLGAHDDPTQSAPRVISLAKSPFTPEEVVTCLERNLIHPLTVPVVEQHDDQSWTIHISALYWAVHRMLEAATQENADAVNAVIATREFPQFQPSPD